VLGCGSRKTLWGRSARRGFTLIELLVTVAVAAVLVVVAAPSMTHFMDMRAVEGRADELAEALRQARSEAMKRGGDVDLCASSNATETTPTCDAASAWALGWMSSAPGASGLQAYAAGNTRAAIEASVGKATFASNGLVKTGCASFTVTAAGAESPPDGEVRIVCLKPQGKVSVSKGGVACCG